MFSSGDEPSATKVIVAEDHPEMRRLLAEQLREAGYDVIEVGDGATLWEAFHEALLDDDNPIDAELIISDIRMPHGTGLEVLARLRGESKVPVILMTAFGDRATIDQAMKLGAAHVFSKPFTLRELINAAITLVPPR